MVYVGTMEFGYGRMKMYHMATDGDINELHKMADAIGIKRKWFQDDYRGTKLHHPHYDVCKSKKQLALQNGAQEINDRELIKRCFPVMHATINKTVHDKMEGK